LTVRRIRRPLLAGNWKMYKSSADGAAFIAALGEAIGQQPDRDVVVAPTFVGLYEAVRAATGTGIGVAAQDAFWEAEGAYTGEVSPRTLRELGVTAVIIGHSERRQHFAETDNWVAMKMRAALDHGLLPIMCVGETGQERGAGLTEEILSTQVPVGLTSVSAPEVAHIAIAYEPIWAIGTGKTATPEIAQEAAAFIRAQVGATKGEEAARSVRVLYGGSVKPDNIDDRMARPDIDGVLVGGASLEVESFSRIVSFGEA
jgi:triosephosphate isomerase